MANFREVERNASVQGIAETKTMDNSSTGLVTSARAGVKTGLFVYLARLKQQNLFSIIGLFLGPVTKR